MAPTVKWDSRLETGHALIDEQHRDFFKHVNHIIEATEAGRGLLEIEKLMDFLDSYVIWHFEAEEKIMKDVSYPEIENHKNAHRDFRDSVAKLRLVARRKGINEHLVLTTNQTIIRWIAEHIESSDQALAAYIEEFDK
ncbi:hemerythrin family protein [Myxococcota bacterium]|nr:hemerythrin family protein [Myxococcota bacterium]